MSAPVFVIAGERRQAEHWARESGVPRSDLVYMATAFEAASRTAGYWDGVFVCVGTWQDRSPGELNEMFYLLASRGFTQLSEDEWRRRQDG